MHYFAYGANMSLSHMAELCPGATCRGTGEAQGWEFYVMPSGFGSIRPDLTKNVHGVVWDISVADITELDWYEDIEQGLYEKQSVDVNMTDGTLAACIVYVGCDTNQGVPLPGYLESILRDARQHGLPKSYVSELEGWLVS